MTEEQTKYVDELFAKAKAAQAVYATFNQEQLDKVARACAKAVFDNAEMLAKEDFAETKMGAVEFKIQRNMNGPRAQWYYTKSRPSTGVIGWEKGKLDQDCLIKIAKPAGIVAGVSPVTNPVQNMASNGMQALKCGNAIIFCPHPRAKNVSNHTCEIIRDYITKAGAPADIVQVVEEPSIEYTQAVMARANVIVATGGPGMVTAACSSGKPSLGVGQGNAQVVIDYGMDDRFDSITNGIVSSRSYDLGILCSGEQTVFVPKKDQAAFLAAAELNGAYILEDETAIENLRKTLFIDRGHGLAPNPAAVGLPVQKIGELIGAEVPENKVVIIVKVDKFAENELLCKEKLCPVIACYGYEGEFEEAVAMAKADLLMEGAGHSSDVYSDNKEHQLHAGLELPVCRLIVNNNNFYVGGGQYNTGMVPTSGLGCGYWGGNAIRENLNFEHLLNYTRMVFTVDDVKAPTDEEIWGED